MKILMRNDESERWQIAESVKEKAEAGLRDLLVESPYLLPVDEIREQVSPLVFAVAEFGLPGSGKTDVLAFSSDGDIAIVECKLAANPESKRKVIGQILEYAAYLWGMSYDEVNTKVQTLTDRNLSELIEEAVAGDWDEESFRSALGDSLDSGSFILIIVVDEINEELRRIIRYLNECTESGFSLHALEVRRFQAGQTEVLVPHLYGVSAKPPAPKMKQWTEERFFEVLAKSVDASVTSLVRDLYEWSCDAADRIWWGHGFHAGSFTFHYLRGGKTVSPFTIYTDGRLRLNYGWLAGVLDEEVLAEFHARLRQIPGFEGMPSEPSKWPSVRVGDAFVDRQGVEDFKRTIEWLRDVPLR